MSTSTSATEPNAIRVGTIYVLEPFADLFIQLYQAWAQSVTTPAPSTAAGDKRGGSIAEVPTPVPQTPLTFSSAPKPAMDAAPTTAPGDTALEEEDGEGDAIAAAPARGAPAGTPPSATSPAPGGLPPLPAPPARARRAWSPRWRRPSLLGSACTTNTADRSMMGDAPVADCCARCGSPGVQTAAWVCGVCDEPFVINGEPLLSLDGLDAELAAGGIYCEKCGQRQPPLERVACRSGCARPERRIADVQEHNRRERDHAGQDERYDNSGDEDGASHEPGLDNGVEDGGRDESLAEAPVDIPEDFPDDGITTDPEIEALLPRESSEEYLLLEQDLLAHGCLSPLVVWQDGPRQVLLDGHIRRAICQARHIPFERKILEFADRASVMAWALKHQLGRRNLTPEAQAYLRGRIYNLEKRQGARTDLDTSRQSGEKLSELLADLYKVGSRTIERDGRFAAHLDHLAAVYGASIKNAVLTRDAKMTRAEVARAASLDASARDRILVRIGQGEAAVDMIREAIRERAVKDPQARAAEADEDAGQAEASASLRDSQGRAEELRDSAPPASGPPVLHDASHLDEHPISVELRRLAAAVRDLKEGELDALYVRRLLQWLFEIQQALAARSQVRAGGDEQHALARERASNAAARSTHRAFDGDEPGRVKNAIEVPLG